MVSVRERIGSFILGVDRDTFTGLAKLPEIGRRAILTEWFYHAPYGQPRNVNTTTIRDLSRTPFIQICINTIIDEFAEAKWNIVPKDKDKFSQSHVDILTKFFNHPNENGETLSDLRRQWSRDLLVLDAAVLVKVFSDGSYVGSYDSKTEEYTKKDVNIKLNKNIYFKGRAKKTGQFKETQKVIKAYHPLKPVTSKMRKLIELYCRDAATFLADGDYTGFIHRWFQYSLKIPQREPFLFDRDEIVYTMKYPRSFSFYGWSPIQSLEDVVRTLKEQVLHSQGLLKERAVPDGLIFIEDLSPVELKRLKEYWKQEIKSKGHRFGVIGRKAGFVPIQVTSKDMELLAGQKWFMKLVMAYYDLNIPILTLSSSAPKAGTEAIVARERRKAVIPLLSLFEKEMNNNIVSEFKFDDVEFVFEQVDIDEKLKEREIHWKDVETQLRTINEIRAELGFDPVEWGDEPVQQQIEPTDLNNKPGQKMLSLSEFKKKIESELKKGK